jgi:hypothetical protein
LNKKTTKTWYVATRVPLHEKTGHYSRRSHTFDCEAAAKQFAASRIADGVEVNAGTLNPVLPRRIVGPSEIAAWLAEESGQSAT